MLEKLKEIAARYELLEEELTNPAVYGNAEKLKKVNRELKELGPVVETYRRYEQAEADRAAAEELMSDPELKEMAQEELAASKAEMERLQQELKMLLIPSDPNDSRNVIMELRGGVGGEEGALFAASLLRMYTMYAESRGWKTEIVGLNETELGGVKECSVLIEGEGAFSRLKFESGVHRVQRVPETESGGRIHTSAATVAVLPEAEDVEFEINPNDLQIDTYRASGAGGQHVNTTDSAIRITHMPTGIVVACQQERSQHKNRATAMAMLKARLYELEEKKRQEQADNIRGEKAEMGWGNQIRSYVLQPYQMVKDLRTGVETGNTAAVLDGDLDQFIEAWLRGGMKRTRTSAAAEED